MPTSAPQDPIQSSFDANGEQVWTAHFPLAGFFGREDVASTGWNLVQQLQSELPEQDSITYLIFEGRLSITSPSLSDVTSSLDRLIVLANLEAAGVVLEPTGGVSGP
jgi:hypothetical protein